MLGILFSFAVVAVLLVALGSAGTIYRLTHPPRLTYAIALAKGIPTHPAELGLRGSERTFDLPDGSRTPAWIMEGEASNGPIVVITHGWGDSRFGGLAWAPLVAPFASRVVAYDLRGQGESTATKCMLGTTEVDDLLAIIDQVKSEGRPIVLFGASMGAGISIAAAAKVPGKIIGVIGDGAYREGMEPVVGFFRENRWPVSLVYLPVGAHLAFWYSSPKQFDRARHAAKLQCPLLLLHGDADPICPFTSAEAIANAAPHGKLVRFEGGGHLDLAATDPERYLEALREFFSQTCKPITVERKVPV